MSFTRYCTAILFSWFISKVVGTYSLLFSILLSLNSEDNTGGFFAKVHHSLPPSSLLYCVLLTNNNNNNRKSYTRNLTPHAYKYITHLILSYHGPAQSDRHNNLLFNTTDHKQALAAAMTQITALTPNLTYLGINFWTPSLNSIFPSFNFDANTTLVVTPDPATSASNKKVGRNSTFPITPYEASSLKTPAPFDHSFLLLTMNQLIGKSSIKTFALLRDGKGRGILDWDRDRKNVMKGVSRDLRNGIAKVLV